MEEAGHNREQRLEVGEQEAEAKPSWDSLVARELAEAQEYMELVYPWLVSQKHASALADSHRVSEVLLLRAQVDDS